MSALVFWKDEHELDNGLKGVMEVHPFDLPGRQFRGAQVSDLIRVLNTKIQARSHEEGIYREVASFLLYGRRVNVHRFLESIIADLPGNSPRLVATMKAHAPSAAEAMICVETLTGKATRIPCTLRESVFCFKLRVQTIVGIRPEDQILIFNDVRLDSRRSLSSYGIQDESIVNLLLGLSGGFSFSRKFADVSNDSLLVTTEFDPDAPNWRTAYKGLNIEGTCTTPSCVAFGKEVIHPKHFKLFNICLDDTAKCPMCRAQVTPLTCGFYDCVWKFEGMKASDNLTIISSWRDAVGEKYHRFNADEKNGMVVANGEVS